MRGNYASQSGLQDAGTFSDDPGRDLFSLSFPELRALARLLMVRKQIFGSPSREREGDSGDTYIRFRERPDFFSSQNDLRGQLGPEIDWQVWRRLFRDHNVAVSGCVE